MFHTYVASVLSGCCRCFCNDFEVFSGVFASVSDAYFSVSSAFKRMLQMFHLVVSKIDQVLLLGAHLPQHTSGRSMQNGVQMRACLDARVRPVVRALTPPMIFK
jgi:hypothetical protein